MPDYMEYVNRDKIANVDNQVLSTFDWDFDIKFNERYAPYHPPINIIKQRLKSINGIKFFHDSNEMSTTIRGYKLIFPGFTENGDASITLNFIDFSDLSITNWLNDWVKKLNDWKTHQSFPKAAVTIDTMTIYQLDTYRNPVWQWTFYTGILSTPGGMDTTGASDKSILGDNVTAQLAFEYWDQQSLTATE